MKRITAACLHQTLHFMLKEGLGHDMAASLAAQEVEQYKAQLDRKRIRYQVVEEKKQPDGSILLKIKREYNHHDCGDYFL